MKKSLLFLLLVLLIPAINSQAQVVISQVYGGGGNSGATFTNDFIELFNAGNAPASLSGLSLQYASATGTGNFGFITVLPAVSLEPGRYYLVQQSGGATGSPLPTPDATGTMAMSATAGKIVLVTGTTSLGCNGGSTPCNADAVSRIIDLVGYGRGTTGANYFEGSGPAPTISATSAAFRVANGCTDSGNNATDFAAGAPAPRNNQTAANPCSPISVMLSINDVTITEGNTGTATATFSVTLSQPALAGGVTFDVATADNTAAAGSDYVAKSLTGQTIPAGSMFYAFNIIINGDQESEPDETFFVNVTNVTGAAVADGQGTGTIKNDDDAPITPIYTIQGSGPASPLVGQIVTTSGVVNGDYQGSSSLNGFFIQDATGDGNTATSDGIFVFSNTPVSVGQIVRVTGTVREVFSQTQIGNTGDSTVVAVQPGAATLTPTVVSLPVSSTAQLEQYEGMLVTFPQVLTVSQNFTLARFGEVWLSADLDYPFNEMDGRLYNPTNFIDPTDNPASGVANAAVAAQQDLHNRASILLDDGSSVQNPATVPYLGPDNTLRVGSTVNNLTGVLGYGFSAYRIQPTQAPAFTYAPRPVTPPSTGSANLKIASFNVLNYFNGDGNDGGFPTSRGADNLNEFKRQRAKIIAALKALDADVVGLIEMENDGDGANSAIADLVRGLNEATAPGTYDYIRDAANGGRGTDAIKVAFIYKPGKVTPVGSPLADLAAVHNRPPLAQTFRLKGNGEIVTAVINHFKSKGGTGLKADADQGDGQGAFNATRVKQAEALVNFINSTVIPAANDHDVIILGDLNAYFEEDPIDVLRAAGFISLFGPESYSYVFNGQSGSLDHALVTPSLLDQFTAGGKWHINADEPIFLDYNLEFKAGNRGNTPDLYEPTPFRSSDHDPVLVGLRLQNPVISFVKEADQIGEKSGEYVVQVQLSKPKQRDEEVLVSITTTAQYGLNGKGDYITMPDGSAGSFKLTIPAGQTTASFTVIPDKNAAKKREPFTISFTLSNQTGGLDVGQPATFDLQIFDDQDGLALGQYAVWPNPTTGPITLSRNAEDYLTDQVKVTLRSDIGEILYSGSGFLPVLSYQLSSRLQSGRAGFYLVEVEANGTLTQIRVLKQ